MDAKLAMKIWQVMDKAENIEKNTEVGKGSNKYSAVGEADVLKVIKPLLVEHKLIIVPVDVEVNEVVNCYTTTDTYNGNADVKKARLITQLKTKWKIIDAETGEFEILASPGNGADPQDKGSGKAWTYAYKAMLQKTFCLFSNEDTDNTHSDDYGSYQKKKDPKQVTTKQLIDAIKNSNQTNETILATYKKDTGIKADEIKYIKQEWKQTYYNMLMEGK